MPRKKNPNPRRRLGSVRIEAECRPEPDWDRFGWALLQHARNVLDAEARRGDKE
jgi:hypothetical protein